MIDSSLSNPLGQTASGEAKPLGKALQLHAKEAPEQTYLIWPGSAWILEVITDRDSLR
jgi:hypothetical protein